MEDNFDDMNPRADGDDEGDDFDDEVTPDDPDDDEFRLDDYGTLGIEHSDDEQVPANEAEYEDTVTGRTRKRVRTAAPTRSILRSNTDDGDTLMLGDGTGLPSKPSSRVPGTWGRAADRKKGDTLPAYHKRVSHELDSDDELMMAMRDKGYSDKAIAEKLKADGRVRYNEKSISTRIMRIREAQAKNVDFLLKEGYKEWEFEDDCLLMQAHALADIEINYEVERIRAWRFRKVSEYMRRLNKDVVFSTTACRERYNALIDGTARIPTEMDDDPDARRFEMESYRQTRENVRNKEQAEQEIKDAKERNEKEAARTRNAKKAAETAAKRKQKEAEKVQRAMQRATAAQVRYSRATENADAKAMRNEQIQKENKEKEKKLNKGKEPSNNITTTDASVERRDPRSYLEHCELTLMCSTRGLPGLGRTKEELISSLQDADDEFSYSDLKKMCQAKGLDTSGDRVQLKYQLALAAAKASRSFQAGVDAAEAAGEEVVIDEAE
ncbi:hypothetical protein IQ06DRAFT_221242 [Phaeosphaeriaceae sp. SRC1lsM3a]|nr:hypothetical protein IQ06DRAFT_221242 [Stagonospora sp. SRC1lsM3a]